MKPQAVLTYVICTDFNLSDIENKIKEIWVTVVLMQKKVEI